MPPKKDLAHKLLFGRRKLISPGISKLPQISSLLAFTPTHRLQDAVSRGVFSNELNRNTLKEALLEMREYRPFSDARRVAKYYESLSGHRLNAQHFGILMAHAIREHRPACALRIWQAIVNRGLPADVETYETVFRALRLCGHWKTALKLYEEMVEDRVVPSSSCLAALIGALRHDPNNYKLCASILSECRVRGITLGDDAITEMLLLYELAAAKNNEVHHDALELLGDSTEITHYNIVLRILARCRKPGQVVTLFRAIRTKGLQLNSGTFEALLSLRASKSPQFVVSIFKQLNMNALPVPTRLYSALFCDFHLRRDSQSALAFLRHVIASSLRDCGNPNNSLHSMYLGFLDALLRHPFPADADKLLTATKSVLEPVVPAATEQFGAMGSQFQRWIVEGRVAVVDRGPVLSSKFRFVLRQYDSVIIPFAVIRQMAVLVDPSHEGPQNERQRQLILEAFFRLKYMQRNKEYVHMRILPLAHQLYAHRFLRKEDLRARSPVQESSRPQLAQSSEGDQDDDLPRTGIVVRHSHLQRAPDESTGKSQSDGDDQSLRQLLRTPQHVISVALMLQTLNPDASICIVSSSRGVLEAARHAQLPCVDIRCDFDTTPLIERTEEQRSPAHAGKAVQPILEEVVNIEAFEQMHPA